MAARVPSRPLNTRLATASAASLGLALVCLAAGPAAAQCVRDADGDGHPLFASIHLANRASQFDDQLQLGAPRAVAFGDLNADGTVDAAHVIASFQGSHISIALGAGDGTFSETASYLAGAAATDVALGDFDGDGDLDLCASNGDDNTVSVFLSRGDGTFQEQAIHAVGVAPTSVIAHDLNGDGLDDLATLNVGSHDVSVLLAAGDGAFAPEQRIFAHYVSRLPIVLPFLAAGDIDGDGDVDLVTPSHQVARVLVNNGEGGFELAPGTIDLDSWFLNGVLLDDFNGDGRLDAAGLGAKRGPISVVLREPDGGWSPPVTYEGDLRNCGSCTYTYSSLAAGDPDGDGDQDLLLGEAMYQYVGIYMNDGAGAFELAEPHVTAPRPWVARFQDVNADGWQDLMMLHDGGGGVRVHLNDGAGTPISPPRYRHGSGDCQLGQKSTAADMDLDGRPDIVLGLAGGGRCGEHLSVHRSDGTGNFSSAVRISLAPAGEADVYHFEVDDINGDGLPDIVVPDAGEFAAGGFDAGSLQVLLNEGGMSFAPPMTYELDSEPHRVAIKDFDGDGDSDVAVWSRGLHPGDPQTPHDRTVELFFNRGDGTLEPGQKLLLEQRALGAPGLLEAADLDNDGHIELLATTSEGGLPAHMWILENDGTGRFTVESFSELDFRVPAAAVVEDFDGDGVMEVAMTRVDDDRLKPYMVLFENDGHGRLTVGHEFVDPNIEPTWSLEAADLDGDGHLDLSVADIRGVIRVHLNRGDGTFGDGVGYDAFGTVQGQSIADFDGDGRLDIAVSGLEYIRTLFNRACPACPADLDGDGEATQDDFLLFLDLFGAKDDRADFTRDGAIDVADLFAFLDAFAAGCG